MRGVVPAIAIAERQQLATETMISVCNGAARRALLRMFSCKSPLVTREVWRHAMVSRSGFAVEGHDGMGGTDSAVEASATRTAKSE